jgi:AraC-like DNA-binding protein
MDPRVEAAVRLIEEGCCSHLTVVGVAAKLGLSRFRLEHLIKRETGKNFRALLCQDRLRAAAELLQGLELSAKEVAYLVGYRSPSALTRAFRRHNFAPPSSWRQQRGGVAHSAQQ